jgi:hypothetical protein
MPLSLQHRHAVLLADRTRDIRTITTVVTEVLAANPETGLLDIETALRAAARQAYLVASSTAAGFQIVLGMPAWHAALADAGLTVEQNWVALARRKCGPVLPAADFACRSAVSCAADQAREIPLELARLE